MKALTIDSRIPYYLSKMDRMAYGLYGLTEEEVRVVEGCNIK